MHKAVKITLHRAEGPTPLPGVLEYAGKNPWSQAKAALLLWSHTAPDDGTIDKTDFTVEYDDGETYEGTFGLTRHDVDLPGHINGNLDYIQANLGNFDHLQLEEGTIEQWRLDYEVGPNSTGPSYTVMTEGVIGHECWSKYSWTNTGKLDPECDGCKQATEHPCAYCEYGKTDSNHDSDVHRDNRDPQVEILFVSDSLDVDQWIDSPHVYNDVSQAEVDEAIALIRKAAS